MNQENKTILNATVSVIENLPMEVPQEGILAGFVHPLLEGRQLLRKDDNLHYPMGRAFYKFGVVVDQSRVRDSIMAHKKSKQRYLDYVFKIGVKRLLQQLITDGIIEPDTVENMYFFVDEHTTATNGVYELRETLEEEFKYGMHNLNFSTFYPPLFPKMQAVHLQYCNSETVTLIRAADITANRIYHDALTGKTFAPFNKTDNKLLVTYLP